MVFRGVFLNSMTMTLRKPKIGHGGGSFSRHARSDTRRYEKNKMMIDGCKPFVPALVDAVDDDAHRPKDVFVLRRTTTTPIEGRRTHGRGDRRTRVVLGATHVFDGTTRSEIAGERERFDSLVSAKPPHARDWGNQRSRRGRSGTSGSRERRNRARLNLYRRDGG